MQILVATYAIPKPDCTGGDLRFCEMLTLLAKRHCVHLWTGRGEPWATPRPIDEYRRQVETCGVTVHAWPTPLRQVLARHCFDVVLCELFWVAAEVMPVFRRMQPHAAVVVDSVDLHFEREALAARLGVIPEEKATATRQAELAVYRAADGVIAVSDADRDTLGVTCPGVPVAVVPIIMPRGAPRRPLSSHDVVFVGSFDWPPNADGITWFVRDVWPLIMARVSQARLTIIGNNPKDDVRRLGEVDGVSVVGYVPATKPFLDRAAVSVAPLRYGGGMKGKVSEAMAAGLPVVTTAVGAQGLGATRQEGLIVTDSPKEFADAVVDLLDHPEEAFRLGRAGQDYISVLCSPEVAATGLEDILARSRQTKKCIRFPLKWFQCALKERLLGLLPSGVRGRLHALKKRAILFVGRVR